MKLLNLFKETYVDNQEVLHTLFAFKDALPLKDCSSQAKVSFFMKKKERKKEEASFVHCLTVILWVTNRLTYLN